MENKTKVRTLDNVKSFEELSEFIEHYRQDESLDIFEKEELEDKIIEKGGLILNKLIDSTN